MNAATRAVIERLVDSLRVANNFLKLAENNLGVEPSGDYDAPLIAEARALLEEPASEDAWLVEAMTLIGLLELRAARLAVSISNKEPLQELFTKLVNETKNELCAHLRARPAKEGFVLVPIEPTWEMTNAADIALGGSSFHDINNTYKAMINATKENGK